jgi:hypothetical protein
MMPFIPNQETFLALALCGSIRDKIVPPQMLADYLLYHLNLLGPELYTSVYDIPPTNDLIQFLAGVATKTGKLLPGGYIDERAAAMEAISRFRRAGLGEWSVDRVTPDAFDKRIKEELLARQRESRGGGDVVESRKPNKGTHSWAGYLIVVKKKGVMTGAIASGRQDARRAVGKGGSRKPRGEKPATRRKAGSGVRNIGKASRGVRKAVNRNKGAKPRKQ